MTTHYIKLAPKYFYPVEIGIKKFDVRFNDRNYKVGDDLILGEYVDGEFTGRTLTKKIIYILVDEAFLKAGYVVLGFE